MCEKVLSWQRVQSGRSFRFGGNGVLLLPCAYPGYLHPSGRFLAAAIASGLVWLIEETMQKLNGRRGVALEFGVSSSLAKFLVC